MKLEANWTRYAARRLRDPRFRAAADAQLALPPTASAISRIENGTNIALKMLARIAEKLRARAEVRLWAVG